MKLRRRAKPQEHEAIVALIDVVFFLLVFFMIVGRMDATAPFEVLPPVAVTGSDLPGGGFTLAVAADGRLALDGAILDQDAAVAEAVERLAADPALAVRINAAAAAPLRFVLPVVSALEAAGARDVAIIVTPNLP
jgi:biopolymer transport protein ExbD